MKKIIMIALILTAVQSVKALSNSIEPMPVAVKDALTSAFPGYEAIKWKEISEFEMYSVNFLYNNEAVVAYIGMDGAIHATVRVIGTDKLPLIVSNMLHKKYCDFEVNKIEELTTGTETSYVMLLDNATTRVTLRMYSDGDFYQIDKQKIKVVNTMASR